MPSFSQTLNKLRERLPSAVDILENSDEVVVVMELPGFEEDSIDIRFVDEELEVKAERSRGYDEYRAIREDRPLTMNKSVPVPLQVEAEGASAEYSNGLLQVHLPKQSSKKPGSRGELESMDYSELQELARDVGVKSTVSKKEMVETLTVELGLGEDGE